jgi:hypothetical protein
VRLVLAPGTVELPDGVDATVKDVHPRALTVRVLRDGPLEPAVGSSADSPPRPRAARRP